MGKLITFVMVAVLFVSLSLNETGKEQLPTETEYTAKIVYDEDLTIIETTEIEYTTKTIKKEYEVPSGDTSFKSYTYYTSISRGSAQWKLQEKAYTDKDGLRKINDDYLVALGSYYTHTLGERFKVSLDSGNVFTIVICDFKSDRHTDESKRYTLNSGHGKNVLEFYVDRQKLDSKARQMGDISYIQGFTGNVEKIEKI